MGGEETWLLAFVAVESLIGDQGLGEELVACGFSAAPEDYIVEAFSFHVAKEDFGFSINDIALSTNRYSSKDIIPSSHNSPNISLIQRLYYTSSNRLQLILHNQKSKELNFALHFIPSDFLCFQEVQLR